MPSDVKTRAELPGSCSHVHLGPLASALSQRFEDDPVTALRRDSKSGCWSLFSSTDDGVSKSTHSVLYKRSVHFHFVYGL